jgi:hypothetical protein
MAFGVTLFYWKEEAQKLGFENLIIVNKKSPPQIEMGFMSE